MLFNMYFTRRDRNRGTIVIAQKRDTAAIQAKLDQIILSGEADNKLIGIERQAFEEIEVVRKAQHAMNTNEPGSGDAPPVISLSEAPSDERQ